MAYKRKHGGGSWPINESMLEGIAIDAVLARDMVQRKKPDPEIYNLALRKACVDPKKVLAIEDSRIGVLVAKNREVRLSPH